MIEVRHPVTDMLDIDKIVRAIGELKSDVLDILPMERGDASTGITSIMSQVHIRTKSYTLMLYFTESYMRVWEYPFEYIPAKQFAINDLLGAEISNNKAIFFINNGSSYGLKDNQFTLDFDNLLNSTSELLDQGNILKHPYRDVV